MTSTGPTRPGPWPPFNECSRCSAALRDHTYADLAVTAAGSSEEATFTGLIEDEAWERLSAALTRPAPLPPDTVTFRALRCPSGGGAFVPLALARTVLGEDCLAGTVYEVSESDLEAISERVTASWHPYSHSWLARANEN